MKNILLIEDLGEIRQWLASLLRDTFGDVVICEAATVAQAYAQLDTQIFELFIIDLNLPDGTGIDVIRRIKAKKMTGLCVVATAYDDDANLLTALNAGADGYLLKEQSSAQLSHDLQGILTGAPPLSPPVARRIMKLAKQEPVMVISTPLSVREEEVLSHIARGMSRSEIAKHLGVSIHTIATQVRSIYSKLDISSRAEAAIEAIRRGLIQP